MAGYIYIFSNISMPEIYKIGFTERKPHERANELSNTSSPTPFKVEYSLLVEEPSLIESEIHQEFIDYRVSENREFFKIDLQYAIRFIETKFNEKTKKIILLEDQIEALKKELKINDSSFEYFHEKMEDFNKRTANSYKVLKNGFPKLLSKFHEYNIEQLAYIQTVFNIILDGDISSAKMI